MHDDKSWFDKLFGRTVYTFKSGKTIKSGAALMCLVLLYLLIFKVIPSV